METFEPLNLTNMATNASLDLLKEAMSPGIFKSGDDVEKFILKTTKYFDIAGTKKGQRSLFVVAFIDKELREIYENEDESLGFEERFRKAFFRPSTMIKDMEEALNYRRNGEHINIYKKKIEGLVEKLMAHKWNKEDLTKEIIMNSCNDRKIKHKIKSGKIEKVEDVFKAIKEWEDIQDEVKPEEINVVRNYRDAVRRIPEQRNFNTNRNEGMQQNRNNERREITCWTCNKIGHVSRNCQERKRKCYACGSEQHLRRECTKVSCSRCNKKGHYAKDCYTNMNRQFSYQNKSKLTRKEFGNGKQRYYSNNTNYYAKRNGSHVNSIEENVNVCACREDKGHYCNDGSNNYQDEYPNGQAPTEVEIVGALN